MQFLRPRFSNFVFNRFFNAYVCNRIKRPRILINKINNFNTGVFLFTFSLFSKNNVTESNLEEQELVNIKQKIVEADELYIQHKYREIYNLLLSYKDSAEVELLWRLCRAMYNLAEDPLTKPDEKKQLIFEAYNIIERSLGLNENSFENHKWMSVLLDARFSYDGTKSRIQHLEDVKNHMLTALKLNSKDATTWFMLGLWCYQIAAMPWYQRKIASTIFADPPVSSFEEALEFFLKAEEVEPRFYCKNLLMLGKTYLKLNKIDKARYYLDLACNYPVSTDDDHLAFKEAVDLLKNIKREK